MRLYLFFHNSIASSPLFRNGKRKPWEAEMLKRLESGIAGFSLTRCALPAAPSTQPRTHALTLAL